MMFTVDDLALLSRPLHGFLTVGAGRPPRPVWFEVTDAGSLQLFSEAAAPKVRRIQDDPRVSLVVATPVGEREHWVSVTGSATVVDGGAEDLAARLGARYWDLDEPARAAELRGMLAGDLVRIVVDPEKVARYAG